MKTAGSDDTDEGENHCYVLNVNFAGNEAHQSAVRKVFLDNEMGTLRVLYDAERTGASTNETIELPNEDGVANLAKCLVFHGYCFIEH